MATDRDLDEILASIRRIVVEEPLVADPNEPPAVAEAAKTATAEVGFSAAAPAVVATPSPTGGTTLEALVGPLLEPLLKRWLDAHLPEIVDAAARDEIRRLTGRG